MSNQIESREFSYGHYGFGNPGAEFYFIGLEPGGEASEVIVSNWINRGKKPSKTFMKQHQDQSGSSLMHRYREHGMDSLDSFYHTVVRKLIGNQLGNIK